MVSLQSVPERNRKGIKIMSKWHEVWEKRKANEAELHCGDTKRVFLELKRIAGWDATGDMLAFEQFYNQYMETKNELEFSAALKTRPLRSIYEVGCGGRICICFRMMV